MQRIECVDIRRQSWLVDFTAHIPSSSDNRRNGNRNNSERMCFDRHTCKHRKGVIHTGSDDGLKPGRIKQSAHQQLGNVTTISTHFPLAHNKNYHQRHFHLSTETRSRREHNNNKLGSTAPITPEDLVNKEESCFSASRASTSTSSTHSLSSGAAGASGRFSRRRLNIFHMSPLLLLLVCVSFAGVTGVRINSLTVPQVIRNGTEESVILDCDYSVDDKEEGLVVKWFHERKFQPVYQWIPKEKPIDLGILKGKLNLDFRADSDELKMHRALQIIRPTIELSGNWICQVSTFLGEAYEAARMIIFAPEKDMGIHVAENRRDGRVNISCWATNVYPEPRLMLFREDQMVDDLVLTTKFVRGAYDVSAYKIIEDANLSSLASLYECELTIPDTNYVRRQTKLYEPGSLELRDELAMGSGGGLVSSEFFNVSAFYFWILLVIALTFSMTSTAFLLQEAASPSSLLFFCL